MPQNLSEEVLRIERQSAVPPAAVLLEPPPREPLLPLEERPRLEDECDDTIEVELLLCNEEEVHAD